MIFKQKEEIRSGRKTQTRRVMKENERYKPEEWYIDKDQKYVSYPPMVAMVVTWNGVSSRIKWVVGKSYAAIPKRGHKAFGRIEIMSIREQRLQAITLEDAIAEGVESIDAYRELWESINKAPGTRWADNPYVWVITFKYLGDKA